MEPRKLLLDGEHLPFMGKAHWIFSANRNKSQSMINMVSLNIIVLKNHILKQDSFGFSYIATIVDMTLEEIIRNRKGELLAIPMELIEVYNAADENLKAKRHTPLNRKDYTRLYVRLWSRLYDFISKMFDYMIAEKILQEAYNLLSGKKYQHNLRIA